MMVWIHVNFFEEVGLSLVSSLLDKTYTFKNQKQLLIWHEVLRVYSLVLLIWGFYRLLSPLPVWLEEIVLKGLVFGLPVWWWGIKRQGWSLSELGLRLNMGRYGLEMGLMMGMVLGMMTVLGQVARGNLQLNESHLQLGQLLYFGIVALATAFWEQLLFAGLILQRLEKAMPDEWSLAWVVGFLFVLLHVPALLLVEEVGLVQGLSQLLLLFSLGMASCVLMKRTRSLIAPVTAQFVWGFILYLFH